MQREISHHVVLNIQIQLRHRDALEPRLANGNEIVARMQRRNRIESVPIRLDDRGEVCFHIPDFNFRVNNYGSGRIGHAAIDAGEFRLGEC